MKVSTGQGQAEKSADVDGRSLSREQALCPLSWKEPGRPLNPGALRPDCTSESPEECGRVPVLRPCPGPLREQSLASALFKAPSCFQFTGRTENH